MLPILSSLSDRFKRKSKSIVYGKNNFGIIFELSKRNFFEVYFEQIMLIYKEFSKVNPF